MLAHLTLTLRQADDLFAAVPNARFDLLTGITCLITCSYMWFMYAACFYLSSCFRLATQLAWERPG
jgi:hypothetical protein